MGKFSEIKSRLAKLDQIDSLRRDMAILKKELESNRLLLGRHLANKSKALNCLYNLQDAEFKVFSQWGDDGIIQFLINHLDIPVRNFVEFGVEDYKEANTRFLLQNDNWSGLVMDSSETHVNAIRDDDIYWKYDLKAICSFVTAENINQTLSNNGFTGDVGLLHIDIDGNDYWIWKAIEVIQPVIVIVEYNSLFGFDRPITIPYEPAFNRFSAHHSGLYAGASILALCDLADSKGYSFIGSNSNANNAYFVRNDRMGDLKPLSAERGFVKSRFREHRNMDGQLTYLSGQDAFEDLRGMDVFNTRTKSVEVL